MSNAKFAGDIEKILIYQKGTGAKRRIIIHCEEPVVIFTTKFTFPRVSYTLEVPNRVARELIASGNYDVFWLSEKYYRLVKGKFSNLKM